MNIQDLRSVFKKENIQPYTFEKEDGILLEDDDYKEWSAAINYLGKDTKRIAMITSEDLSDFEAIYNYFKANESLFEVLSDSGEGVMYGDVIDGIDYIVSVGPVCCIMVAEENISFLKG